MSLAIVRATGLVTIQDLGRRGRMHEAIPPGGALVPELLVVANRAVHNPDHAAAIEVIGKLVVRADAPITVATDRIAAHVLHGELAIESEPRRVTYLALRGSVAAPLVLGGRGALLCAGLGTLLRAGMTLHADHAPVHHPVEQHPARPVDPDEMGDAGTIPEVDRSPDAFAAEDDELEPEEPGVGIGHAGPIHLIPGPDRDAFTELALATLCAAPYTISPASDRTGTRLVGAPLPRRADYQEVSRPMVIGALEVPRDGAPIVLGPEHPTTGGYPVVAVIAAADRGRFFATRIGGSVTFTCRR